MPLTTEQVLTQIVLELLPQRQRTQVQDAANYTFLVFLRCLVSYAKKYEIRDKDGKVMSVNDLVESIITTAKYNIPVDPISKSNIEDILCKTNKSGLYIAASGLGAVTTGRFYLSFIAFCIAWVLLCPSLIQNDKLAIMIEDSFKDDLTWGAVFRDRLSAFVLEKRRESICKLKLS